MTGICSATGAGSYGRYPLAVEVIAERDGAFYLHAVEIEYATPAVPGCSPPPRAGREARATR